MKNIPETGIYAEKGLMTISFITGTVGKNIVKDT